MQERCARFPLQFPGSKRHAVVGCHASFKKCMHSFTPSAQAVSRIIHGPLNAVSALLVSEERFFHSGVKLKLRGFTLDGTTLPPTPTRWSSSKEMAPPAAGGSFISQYGPRGGLMVSTSRADFNHLHCWRLALLWKGKSLSVVKLCIRQYHVYRHWHNERKTAKNPQIGYECRYKGGSSLIWGDKMMFGSIKLSKNVDFFNVAPYT